MVIDHAPFVAIPIPSRSPSSLSTDPFSLPRAARYLSSKSPAVTVPLARGELVLAVKVVNRVSIGDAEDWASDPSHDGEACNVADITPAPVDDLCGANVRM